MREQIARIIARECSGAESIWKSKARVVDLILDALLNPTEELQQIGRRAMDAYMCRTGMGPFGPDCAGEMFAAMVQAIKDGK